MLSREHIGAMHNAPDVTMSADMRRLLIEHIDEQQAEIDALRKHAEALHEALDVFADDDPCDFDHHGYCQAHSFLGPDPGCGVADAHKILDDYRAAYPKEDSDADQGTT